MIVKKKRGPPWGRAAHLEPNQKKLLGCSVAERVETGKRKGSVQPAGLKDSSRWSKQSADHRNRGVEFEGHPEGVQHQCISQVFKAWLILPLPVVCAPLRPPAIILQPFRLTFSGLLLLTPLALQQLLLPLESPAITTEAFVFANHA